MSVSLFFIRKSCGDLVKLSVTFNHFVRVRIIMLLWKLFCISDIGLLLLNDDWPWSKEHVIMSVLQVNQTKEF